jgi:predicted nuclease of predicted toxin-antitoxin system
VKIKLDENIPQSLSPALKALGHDVRTVVDQGLTGHPDAGLWSVVAAEERFLVIQDVDFGKIAVTSQRGNAGILLLRLEVPSRSALLRRAKALFGTEDVSRWRGCLVVATERKIRVRRP